MARPLPSSLILGPLTWSVRATLEDYHQASLANPEPGTVMGFTIVESLSIVLKPDMPRSLEQETLMHELLHAIYATQGATLKLAKRSELEEASVCALSPMLLTALRENPELVRYLLKA